MGVTTFHQSRTTHEKHEGTAEISRIAADRKLFQRNAISTSAEPGPAACKKKDVTIVTKKDVDSFAHQHSMERNNRDHDDTEYHRCLFSHLDSSGLECSMRMDFPLAKRAV